MCVDSCSKACFVHTIFVVRSFNFIYLFSRQEQLDSFTYGIGYRGYKGNRKAVNKQNFSRISKIIPN